MNQQEFRNKHNWDKFPTIEAVRIACKEARLVCKTMRVFINYNGGETYYSIIPHKHTPKVDDASSERPREVTITIRTLFKNINKSDSATKEALLKRQYEFVDHCIDNIGESGSLFGMMFGFNEPSDRFIENKPAEISVSVGRKLQARIGR